MGTIDDGGHSHGMMPPDVRRGLCMTCNNAPHCYFRKRRGGDALFCEMFDDSGPARRYHPSIDSPEEPQADAAEAIPEKGLCINCLYRHTCHLPKPESGVWHCELYR